MGAKTERLTMSKISLLGASFLALAATGAFATEPDSLESTVVPEAGNAMTDADTLIGEAAFTGWEESQPGVTRLIRPEDLPEPFVTE